MLSLILQSPWWTSHNHKFSRSDIYLGNDVNQIQSDDVKVWGKNQKSKLATHQYLPTEAEQTHSKPLCAQVEKRRVKF